MIFTNIVQEYKTMVWDDSTIQNKSTCRSKCAARCSVGLILLVIKLLQWTHVISQEYLTDSLLGGDVVSVTVVLNGPVTPVLVTAAT